MQLLYFWVALLLSTTIVVNGRVDRFADDEAIKMTIHSQDGDLIDCYDIYQQPALNHPLLKDHKLKLKPNKTMKDLLGPSSSQVNQKWHMSGVCPEGTVPIRRTSHDTNNFSNFSFSYAQLGQMNHAGPQRTEAVIDYSTHGPYLGASAALTLWDPHVEPNTNEYSNTFIMVGGVKPNKKANESLPFDNLDYQIALGWAVFPAYYKDSLPRLHLYLTLDGGDQEVCINSECLLVQTSSKIFPGASLTQSSQPGGQISHIDVYIHRELSDDKWWVSLNHEAIGYYPKEAVEAWMFGSLTMRGALVFNTMPRRQHTSTQMGSGHFPSEGANYSAGIYDYYSVTNSGQLGIDPAKTIVTKPNCYNYMGLEPTKFNKSFLYGGPGGAGCDS